MSAIPTRNGAHFLNDGGGSHYQLVQLQSILSQHIVLNAEGPHADVVRVLLSTCKHLVDHSLRQQSQINDLLLASVSGGGGGAYTSSNYHNNNNNNNNKHMEAATTEVSQAIRQLSSRVDSLDVSLKALTQRVSDNGLLVQPPDTRGEGNLKSSVTLAMTYARELQQFYASGREPLALESDMQQHKLKAQKQHDYVCGTINDIQERLAHVEAQYLQLRRRRDGDGGNVWAECHRILSRAANELKHGKEDFMLGQRTPHSMYTAEETSADSVCDHFVAFLKAQQQRTSSPPSCDAIRDLSSRLDVLEVYAPHTYSVATRPPLLGIELEDVVDAASHMSEDTHHIKTVRIRRVFDGFIGAHVGLRVGDVIAGVDDHTVRSRAEMLAVLTELVRQYQARCQVRMEDALVRQTFVVGEDAAQPPIRRDCCSCSSSVHHALPQMQIVLNVKRGDTLRRVSVVLPHSSVAGV